ncbi:hypothetical protein BEK98_17105 [Streptomyces diastatochromogenes]|uniref:Uncharacterized protein n=1 Tax=Streptomyces diastatochromogenes TaxID=42236 RepID=A0A233SGR4_STRDA|nr:hypothetical protein BEK98_17105 [Streptomyces diastatochromogenes]
MCPCRPGGRLARMTTHRSAKTLTRPAQPVERAVTAALVLAVVAGLAWIGGMFWTLLGWQM